MTPRNPPAPPGGDRSEASPADRFAAARRREADGARLTEFQRLYDFEFDDFQLAACPALAGLGHVVLDEVHYLADRFRGAVWEEVIIHLDQSVQLTALSATVSNAEEFGDWLTQVRGGTTVIVDEHRPVPLWQHMLAGR